MLFALKKYVGGLMMPLPLLLLLTGIGLVILWCTRWQRSGRILITVSWLLLLLLSLQPVADRLLYPIETHYPTWQGGTQVNNIVVLGGGYTWNPAWAPSSNLVSNSLPRVAEGVRLWRAMPDARMIFTGAAAPSNPVSTAEAGARVAQSLGVPRSAIITLDAPKDTEEEAAAVAGLLGQQPFILITSASHLPRAVQFFHARGLHPIPAPANQLAITSALQPWEYVIPAPIWLMHSDRAVYERLGRLWQWLKGISYEPGQ
ncbi:envelope biogenesis factor ElyC [Apirhabdus apintestini]|nr:envelope biogenesis factor ElyC [Enterobacteriaceae bacterium CA-0114]